MMVYNRLLLHPRLLAPMRLALLARNARAAPGWRLDVWENEGGAIKSLIQGIHNAH